jgi:hypothetical protein
MELPAKIAASIQDAILTNLNYHDLTEYLRDDFIGFSCGGASIIRIWGGKWRCFWTAESIPNLII